MKKIVYAFILLSIIVSCGLKDKNISLVKREFKTYAQNNYDDPAMLKEIVEITASDTISLSKIKSMVAMSDSLIDTSRELYKMKDSLGRAQLEEQYKALRKSMNISYSDALSGQLLLIEMTTTAQKVIDFKTMLVNQQASLNQLCDSLEYKPSLYVYDIKYRKLYPEGLKLETAYAYVDSLSGFRSILTEREDGEIMCPEYKAVFEKSKDCMITLSNIETLYQEQDKQIEELKKFFLSIK